MKPQQTTRIVLSLILLSAAVWTVQAQDQPETMPWQELTAQELMPLSTRQMTFEITEGDREGETVQVTLQRSETDLGDWELAIGDMRITYLSQTEENDIVINAQDLKDEGYRVVYQPAVPLIPARMRPDRTLEDRSRVTVYNLEDGSVKDDGTVRHHVELLGRVRVQTPEQEYQAYMIRVDHQLDLSMLNMDIELDIAYHPELGRVYQRMTRTHKLLGLFPNTEIQTLRITAPPGETVEQD